MSVRVTLATQSNGWLFTLLKQLAGACNAIIVKYFSTIGIQVNISPSPVTAALAGIFSAIVWPLLWSRFGGSSSGGTVEVVVITLLVIALPAHAFVIGFHRTQAAAARTLDTALLKRIGAWLFAAAATAAVGAIIRGQLA